MCASNIMEGKKTKNEQCQDESNMQVKNAAPAKKKKKSFQNDKPSTWSLVGNTGPLPSSTLYHSSTRISDTERLAACHIPGTPVPGSLSSLFTLLEAKRAKQRQHPQNLTYVAHTNIHTHASQPPVAHTEHTTIFLYFPLSSKT